MCDCQSTSGMSRREAIVGSLVVGSALAAVAGFAAVTPAAAAPAIPPVEVLPGLSIYPRDAWKTTLKPARRLGVVTL